MEADIAKTVAERNARAAASGSTTRMFFGTPKEIAAQRAAANAAGNAGRQTAGTARAALPKGMGGGKIAAIVAGVALAGGALYAVTRKKDEPPVGAWTDRIQAERAVQPEMSPTR
jgi:hypothetical protein